MSTPYRSQYHQNDAYHAEDEALMGADEPRSNPPAMMSHYSSRPFSPIQEEDIQRPPITHDWNNSQIGAPSEWSSSNTVVSGASGASGRPLPSPRNSPAPIGTHIELPPAVGFRARYLAQQQRALSTPPPLGGTPPPMIHTPPFHRESSPIAYRESTPFREQTPVRQSTPLRESTPLPQPTITPLASVDYGYSHTLDEEGAEEHYEAKPEQFPENPQDDDDTATLDGPGSPYEDEDADSIDQEKAEQTQHYGPAPRQRQERRLKLARKQVDLLHGNLVLDCPVPSKLQSFLPKHDHEEFTHMRYTAATCDPNDFEAEQYTLRPRMYGRETELFVVVTLYNEDEILLTRTLHGVMKNIAHLCSRTRSRTWGKDGWKKVVVCIVADGRKKVHPRVLNVLAAMGVYQEGIAKNLVGRKEVQAHIYEYTSQISIDPELRFKGAEKGIMPVQFLYCLKEQNLKKLNSHRWFFNAFAPILKPTVCVLIDVGTRPGPKSIYHLWKCFDLNSNVGGACGEIQAMKGRYWSSLLNPLVGAQNFEYKMSNILDKPLESAFGYITVLPGAFSAYRYHALQNDKFGNGPLASYFKGEKLHGRDADIFTANMYLAEDRILCFELIAKRNENWKLQYVRAARGETDVPDSMPEFISQRRRWLNGSFFAAVYAISHIRQVLTTSHTRTRKIGFMIETAYNAMSLVVQWFGLANYYLTFYYVAMSLADPKVDPFGGGWGQRFYDILKYALFLLIATQFVLSLGNRPQGSKRLYVFTVSFLSFIQLYMFFASIYLTVKGINTAISESVGQGFSMQLFANSSFRDIFVSTIATYGVYWIMSILYMDPWHMITSFQSYMLMMPSYVIVLTTYAYCNTHDVSWGTKGEHHVNTDLGAAVSTGKGDADKVEIFVPTEEQDVNGAYEEALLLLRERRQVPKSGPDARTIQEDYYREIRTRLVLAWMISNAILVMIVTSTQFSNVFTEQGGQNIYLRVLLWLVAGLTIFRASGSLAYLAQQSVEFTARRKGGHAGNGQKMAQVRATAFGSAAVYNGVTPTAKEAEAKHAKGASVDVHQVDLEHGDDGWNASFEEDDEKRWRSDNEEDNYNDGHEREENSVSANKDPRYSQDGYGYGYGFSRTKKELDL